MQYTLVVVKVVADDDVVVVVVAGVVAGGNDADSTALTDPWRKRVVDSLGRLVVIRLPSLLLLSFIGFVIVDHHHLVVLSTNTLYIIQFVSSKFVGGSS